MIREDEARGRSLQRDCLNEGEGKRARGRLREGCPSDEHAGVWWASDSDGEYSCPICGSSASIGTEIWLLKRHIHSRIVVSGK